MNADLVRVFEGAGKPRGPEIKHVRQSRQSDAMHRLPIARYRPGDPEIHHAFI